MFQAIATSAKSCMTTPPTPQPLLAPLGPRAQRCPLPGPASAPRQPQPGPLGPLSPRPPSPKPRSLWLTSSAGPKRPRVGPWRKPGHPPTRGPRAAVAARPLSPYPQVGRWCPGTAPLQWRCRPPSLAMSTTPSCITCWGPVKGRSQRMVSREPTQQAGPWAWAAGLEGASGLLLPLPPLPAPSEFEDDKISLSFVVTDLRGRSLRPMRERAAVQVGAGGSRQARGQPQGACWGGGWHSPSPAPPPPAHRAST